MYSNNAIAKPEKFPELLRSEWLTSGSRIALGVFKTPGVFKAPGVFEVLRWGQSVLSVNVYFTWRILKKTCFAFATAQLEPICMQCHAAYDLGI